MCVRFVDLIWKMEMLFRAVNSRVYVQTSTEQPTLAVCENRHFYTSSTYSNRQVVDSTTQTEVTRQTIICASVTHNVCQSLPLQQKKKKNLENLEKTKNKKTNPWDGKDLGGWGVSFCFLLVLFSRYVLLLTEILKKTKRKHALQYSDYHIRIPALRLNLPISVATFAIQGVFSYVIFCAHASLDGNMSLKNAIAPTEHLILRELDAQVRVGPLPSGAMLPMMLPLKQFLGIKVNFSSYPYFPKSFLTVSVFCLHGLNQIKPSIKHLVDIIYDVEPKEVDIDSVSATIRDNAWEELPNVLKLAEG